MLKFSKLVERLIRIEKPLSDEKEAIESSSETVSEEELLEALE